MSNRFTHQGNVNQNYIEGFDDGRIKLPSNFFYFQESETKHKLYGCREKWHEKTRVGTINRTQLDTR
jgi:hypothetical protein